MHKNKRKTTKQFKEEVFNLVGDEFEVIGEYINAKTKIEIKHKKCGTIFMITPDSFLNGGTRCKKCTRKKISDSQKKTSNQFEDEMFKKYGDEYTIIEGYVNARTKVIVKHNRCGRILEVSPRTLLKSGTKTGCKYCSSNITNEKNRKTNEDFVKEVYEITKGEYTPLSEYKGNKIKVVMRHNKCGNIYEVKPAHFLTKSKPTRCPICQRKMIDDNRRRTDKEFKNIVKELANGEYITLSKYNTCEDKVKFKHKECGHTFSIRAESFIQGQRCPICSKSRGEIAIVEYLDKHNIKYETQYLIKECRGKRRPLPFDVAVLNNDSTLNMLIEFDGKQHYIEVKHFGGKEGLEQRKLYDSIKDNYCKANGIKLLRIPYNEYKNIDTILSKEIKLKENIVRYKQISLFLG